MPGAASVRPLATPPAPEVANDAQGAVPFPILAAGSESSRLPRTLSLHAIPHAESSAQAAVRSNTSPNFRFFDQNRRFHERNFTQARGRDEEMPDRAFATVQLEGLWIHVDEHEATLRECNQRLAHVETDLIRMQRHLAAVADIGHDYAKRNNLLNEMTADALNRHDLYINRLNGEFHELRRNSSPAATCPT